ncbi:MAG: hypothetical protein K6C06_09170 [Lachnospiraceae bacterium]|nr:hypothetical protein [Lachnospiraceae bacterium]
MNDKVPVINQTAELSECRDQWFFDLDHGVWCLEDILYTQKASVPKFQRMSIFVPKSYMNEDGTVNEKGKKGRYTTRTAPVVFENNSAGYMQMPHTWLGGPRDEAGKYLERGMVYVTCGCRGRDSRDEKGVLCGKSPWTLVDLKTAIRFLRHNAVVLPGDMDKMISVGWSAGGAMSALLGVTGNSSRYEEYLKENGAFMDERDDVLAAQIYCPIIDLEHADIAYEWQFCRDKENESSPAGPAGVMTPFREALSAKLAKDYIGYFNGLGLKDEKGHALVIGPDGRSGSGCEYLMSLLNDSAADYLRRLSAGTLEDAWTPEDYLTGNYTHKVQAPAGASDKKDDLGLHHAGAAVMLSPAGGNTGGQPGHPGLGDLVSRPPKGVPYKAMEPPMVEEAGKDKRAWLSWDGEKAAISSLDEYILSHRRRMKPCTSFDTLDMNSAENREFGTPERDSMRFDPYLEKAVRELKDEFPAEYEMYYPSFAGMTEDKELALRMNLIDPFYFIGTGEICDQAEKFRIRVGAQDADTAFTISMTLALKLTAEGKDTDYALIWDRPHCQADYPGEVCDWIESFTAEA